MPFSGTVGLFNKLQTHKKNKKCRAHSTAHFFNGGFIIGNDYVRMYIVEHHHTRGDLRLVRRGSWSQVFWRVWTSFL